MTFQDEQKQAEFEAFSTYYRLVAQRPHTSAKMSRLNQLESIIRGDFPGALQELKAEQRKQQVERTAERKVLGKPEGSALTWRGSLPVSKQPQPGTGRYERLKAAGMLPSQQAAQAQSGRSEAAKVVAGGEPAEKPARIKRIETKPDPIPELKQVQLSTGDDFDTETGRTENNLIGDARELSAKDLVERYGRYIIAEYLFGAGFELDSLSEKTDRQLANALKKHVTE